MTHPTDIIATCSCSCPITREYVALEQDAGRTKIQECDGCDWDLLLFQCPNCRSHRSLQIPTLRRGVLLAMMPTIATLNGVG